MFMTTFETFADIFVFVCLSRHLLPARALYPNLRRDLINRHLCFFVQIGVAGRTGCGKSTLMMALYRIVEPSGGRILIDGCDTSRMGLTDLRSRLALVPQVWKLDHIPVNDITLIRESKLLRFSAAARHVCLQKWQFS